MTAHPGVVQDVEVVGKVRCSDHRMVRARIRLDLKKERQKLIRKKRINELALRGKVQEFRVSLQNRYSALSEETNLSVDTMNDNLTSIITECAVEVGGRVARQDTGKLSQETKNLIKKHQIMKVSSTTDKIELAELSKLINRRKVCDVRRYNMERIEHALKNGGSVKAVKRKLWIGKRRMYALRNKEGKITTNMDRIVKIAEEFYRDLYSSRDNHNLNTIKTSSNPDDTPPGMIEEVRKALEGMHRGKAAGEDRVTSDLLKDEGQIVLEKLATLFTRCLLTGKVPEYWKNAIIILIHKKGDDKD
uniref:Putative endonuclease-reverse transcriptase n=1 Tax=Rhipicephalus microplus TaxID=6941 RepID=A0A6G5A9L5_RHIMP